MSGPWPGRRARVVAISLLASTPARAENTGVQAPGPDADAGKGRGEEEEVLILGRQTSGFVSRARIENSPREITDAASLVEPLPGVHVRRLGADDSFATMSIRGSSSSQVAVYLAGVPLSGGADPTLDLATLPLWPGAQARVFRSFAPAALGRGSLGGTLVLDPPSPRSPARTDVWAAAGAFGSRRLRIGDVRGEPNGVRIASGVSASRSDDDFSYVDPDSSRAGREVLATRRNAGHAAAAGLASVVVPIHVGPREGSVTMTGMAQARRQEIPGRINYPSLLLHLDSTRLLTSLELSLPVDSRGAFVMRGWGRREGLSIRDDRRSALDAGAPSSTDDAIIAAGGSAGWR
ncbi:MAG TPA: TonB-dependent receptor plug domain-containing protein, partial [Labilithrix sp.]|nr:TonB-dependent receptor plug domain-containing protein [Labilithrix sp.]